MGNYATAEYLSKLPDIYWFEGIDGGYYYGRPNMVKFSFGGISGRSGTYFIGTCYSANQGSVNIAFVYTLRFDRNFDKFWVHRSYL